MCSGNSQITTKKTRATEINGGTGGLVPHPNIGNPGTGDFTLTFLGDAGVAGRADIMGD